MSSTATYSRPDESVSQGPPPRSHMSTSSSVYSPLDSEFGMRTENDNTPRQQQHQQQQQPLHLRNSMASEDSYRQRLPSIDSELTPDESHRMATEVSNQTIQTFVTADSGFSFGSINDSILNDNRSDTLDISGETINDINTAYGAVPEYNYDEDATPIIPTIATYDPIDKTPIVQEGMTFDRAAASEEDESNDLNNHRASRLFPQRELSNKFKRLSMTLQQSNQFTSGESVEFMSNFLQNVERMNNESSTNRTSLYYKKIHEKTPEETDEEDRVERTMVARVVDDHSTSSTLSNRSSVLSDGRYVLSSAHGVSSNSLHEDIHKDQNTLPQVDDGNKSLSNNSFCFNNGSSSTTSSQVPSNQNSYVDLKGARVSPLKLSRNVNGIEEEAPIRKDLVEKFEKLSTEQPVDKDVTLSDKEKNDYLINKHNMTEKYPLGLNIAYNTDSVLDPKHTDSSYTIDEGDTIDKETTVSVSEVDEGSKRESITSSVMYDDDEDLSTLFVRALHTFDSSTLQSESDVSICLSFEKDELAFVHTIDESGWGEVTLINSLKRGWIPMNYFSIAVGESKNDSDTSNDSVEEDGILPNSAYLRPLFHACGKFLMNPLSHKNRRDKYTFLIRVINSIRDGVRILLQETDCLSRSNEIVTKRPIVRKTRKSLLADWYNLMLKANQYKGTYNFNKIEVLTLMVYQVSRKAVAFLEVWSTESRQVIKRENEKKLQNDMNNYPLLATPPQAKQRITELNGLLYSYLGMIIGRLDLIEHNPVGCELLESLAHQIILLLRELLFISKTGSDFSSEKPAELDGSLDTLLSLVSDLVSGVKSLVVKTLNESDEDKKNSDKDKIATDYYYTEEGGSLLMIASKMVKAISITIASIRKLLDVTGDFKLNAERSYPDYTKMKIEADELIRKCSIGIAKAHSVKNRELRHMKRPANARALNRYSMMRSGKTGDLGLTDNGTILLHDVLVSDVDGSSPFSISNSEFQPFSHTDPNTPVSERHNIKDELLVDSQGNLLGASFKGLVFTLTNESSPPEYFFVSTFFICFRSFANGIDLIEELISRFEVNNKEVSKKDVSAEVKLKNRRRLIAKMFQLWLESYWNQEADYSLLTTLINFFNECLSLYLPLDAIKLIEVAAKLSSKPLIENQKPTRKNKTTRQIFNRSITITHLNRKNSALGSGPLALDNSVSARYSMVDGYELSKINTNTSTSTSLTSMSLPMPLGVGNQTSSSHSLLSKSQLVTIEKVNLTYRAILGDSWCNPKFIDHKQFVPLELKSILPNWYNVCDQNWVLSNYRPNLLDFNGLEIAKQLTLIESSIFCSIRPDELLNENFTAKRAHLKLAPNIRQSLLFTNCLSGYVLESTLQPKINQKMRINIIKTWLKVAISCLYLRNFNSLAAILTALQSHLVTRLTRVWAELSPKYRDLYEYLAGIVHPDKNYTVYRTKLRNFLVSNDYNIPIVPYFSLFLQDLTFVADGNPSYRKADSFLNQKLINIDKYLKLTRIIADIESLQIPYIDNGTSRANKRTTMFSMSSSKTDKVEDYHIIAVPSFQELILLELWKVCQLNRKEDDRAWKLSLLIHPRDAN